MPRDRGTYHLNNSRPEMGVFWPSVFLQIHAPRRYPGDARKQMTLCSVCIVLSVCILHTQKFTSAALLVPQNPPLTAFKEPLYFD
jgi:hypothetical protein